MPATAAVHNKRTKKQRDGATSIALKVTINASRFFFNFELFIRVIVRKLIPSILHLRPDYIKLNVILNLFNVKQDKYAVCT